MLSHHDSGGVPLRFVNAGLRVLRMMVTESVVEIFSLLSNGNQGDHDIFSFFYQKLQLFFHFLQPGFPFAFFLDGQKNILRGHKNEYKIG